MKTIGTIGIVGGLGTGTVNAQSETQQITDWNDLHAIRDGLDGEYILTTDLDESTAGYEEYVADPETGFEPIGKTQTEFTGTFDGQGNEIRDLVIEKPDSELVGLFGLAGDGAIIENITLVDVEITGDYDVGALIGGSNGTINTSAVTGAVSGRRNVGGIVGRNRKAIIRDSAAGVTITGESNVGGLVGKNDNKIRNSWATGKVTGESSVGGLVGLLNYTGFTPGTIIESWASGDVDGDSAVGGLVGDSFHNDLNGEIMKSAASGAITGESEVGGLIGSIGASTIITNSVALGQVTGTEYVGGFAGYNRNTIRTSFSCGNVTGDQQIGGFI
ncbi:GLUG motif-containing protein [Halonotius aquaticus]|uniref:GLUG motif-containing protein n=1 Tax=Halonotius aquaticus TaxID=2216978 RepID=UPI0014026FFE|nr:GLUG motif-containing protein [Halonotius aquaticus]